MITIGTIRQQPVVITYLPASGIITSITSLYGSPVGKGKLIGRVQTNFTPFGIIQGRAALSGRIDSLSLVRGIIAGKGQLSGSVQSIFLYESLIGARASISGQVLTIFTSRGILIIHVNELPELKFFSILEYALEFNSYLTDEAQEIQAFENLAFDSELITDLKFTSTLFEDA
jgi:hypothetical protein